MANPLTGRTENAPGEMTVELLRYANRERVAQALTQGGYRVSRNTVNRWARGDECPTIAQRMILHLFGHDEAAPAETGAAPAWARTLTQNIISEVRALRDQSMESAADAAVRAAAESLGSQILGEHTRGTERPRRDTAAAPAVQLPKDDE